MSILRDPNGPDGCAQRPPWLSPSELEQEELDAEFGAQFGDPRRCPRHPHVATSSPDGMHDAPCGVCEAEMEDGALEYASRAEACSHAQLRDALGVEAPIHWIGTDEHGDPICMVPEFYELSNCVFWIDEDGNAHVTS